MSYEIRKSDGTLLLELGDGFTDKTSSSLTFIGKNVSKFGELQNNNFLHLLENFAASTEPANKITGQLWFDKSTNGLKVYNTNKWQNLAVMTYSTSSSISSTLGNLWFNSDSQQLFINNGSGFSLIGPDGAPDFGSTRMITTVLADLLNEDHPVVECVIDGEVVAIISGTSFDVNSSNGLTGFPYVYKGITFKNGTTTEVQLYGWSKFADSANKLKNESGDFVVASTTATSNSIVQRNNLSGISVTDITASSITTSTTGIISGTWTVNSGFNPDTNGGANLGTNLLRWSNVYAQTADATTLNATTVKFSNLTDSNLASITRFDTDTSLTANSDSRLATQRAIKKYIDDAVAEEIQNRISADNSLQSQISGFQGIPTGTIMYTPSSSVPSGYLAVNGQSLSKSTYAGLYSVIGNTYGSTDTTFKLPDLRGEFIRVWDNNRGVDIGRTLGSTQSGNIQSHSHPYVDTYFKEHWGQDGQFSGAYGSNGGADNDNYDSNYQRTTSATGGEETRPRNIALQAIIKY
jgi:hypothetical protein